MADVNKQWKANDRDLGGLRRAIAYEPRLGEPQIRISMLGPSRVLLSGSLDSEEQRALVLSVAIQAVPALEVENGLSVCPPWRNFNDAELTPMALHALEQTLTTLAPQPGLVTLAVRDGIASLQGFCASQADLDTLVAVVKAVPGLREVRADAIVIRQVATGIMIDRVPSAHPQSLLPRRMRAVQIFKQVPGQQVVSNSQVLITDRSRWPSTWVERDDREWLEENS